MPNYKSLVGEPDPVAGHASFKSAAGESGMLHMDRLMSGDIRVTLVDDAGQARGFTVDGPELRYAADWLRPRAQ